jgi:hypothetical protein
MGKINPLKADRLGPLATVRMDGKDYKVLRPTSLGWELETLGSRPEKKFLFHAQLERGEDDGTIVVKRSRREDPSLQSLSLKARRDIFIKNWWMSRITVALSNHTLESTGDVALGTFITTNLPHIRRDLGHGVARPAMTTHPIADVSQRLALRRPSSSRSLRHGAYVGCCPSLWRRTSTRCRCGSGRNVAVVVAAGLTLVSSRLSRKRSQNMPAKQTRLLQGFDCW